MKKLNYIILIALLIFSFNVSATSIIMPLNSTNGQGSFNDLSAPTGVQWTNGMQYYFVQPYATATNIKRMLLKWNNLNSQIPQGSVIDNVTIQLYMEVVSGTGTITMNVHRLTSNWTDSQMTWNNRVTGTAWGTAGGDFNSTIMGNITFDSTLQYYNITLDKSQFQYLIDNPSNNFGLIFKGSNENINVNNKGFTSLYNTTGKTPTLFITYHSGATNFTATVIENNGSTINTFNMTMINGGTSNYNTTNTTIITNKLTNSTSLYNITFNSVGFISKTYNNINLSINTTIQANLTRNTITTTLNYPINNYHTNEKPINLTYNITSNIYPINCDININGIKNTTQTQSTNGTKGYSINLNDANYNWTTNCSDGLNTATSTSQNFTIDTTNPVWTIRTISTSNTTAIDRDATPYINFNDTITDANLFAYNITAKYPNGSVWFSNQTINLNTTTFNYTINKTILTTQPNGTYSINYYAEDDHTAKQIQDYDNLIDMANKQIRYITNNDTTIYLKALKWSTTPTSFSTQKEIDRYTWDFNFTSGTKPYTFTFGIISTKPIYYRGMNLGYPNFVTGKNWIDFNLNSNATYQVSQVNSTYYNITITTNQSNLHFSSLGGLNIVNETYTFNIFVYSPPNITGKTPTSGFTQYAGTNISFKTNATDPANLTLTYNYYYDGTLNYTGQNYTFLTPFQQGNHNMTIIVINSANKQTSYTWNFTINITTPTIIGTSPTQNFSVYDGTNFTFYTNATDPINLSLTYKYYYDNILNYIGQNYTFDVPHSQHGQHTMKVNVTNQGGNNAIYIWNFTIIDNPDTPTIDNLYIQPIDAWYANLQNTYLYCEANQTDGEINPENYTMTMQYKTGLFWQTLTPTFVSGKIWKAYVNISTLAGETLDFRCKASNELRESDYTYLNNAITILNAYYSPGNITSMIPNSGNKDHVTPLKCELSSFGSIPSYKILYIIRAYYNNTWETISVGTNNKPFFDMSKVDYGQNVKFSCQATDGLSVTNVYTTQNITRQHDTKLIMYDNGGDEVKRANTEYGKGLLADFTLQPNITIISAYADCNGDGYYDYYWKYNTTGLNRTQELFTCYNSKGIITHTIGVFINKTGKNDLFCGKTNTGLCKIEKTYDVIIK